jgi:hypothetical protein
MQRGSDEKESKKAHDAEYTGVMDALPPLCMLYFFPPNEYW